jgi:hypothetical protein
MILTDEIEIAVWSAEYVRTRAMGLSSEDSAMRASKRVEELRTLRGTAIGSRSVTP